MRSHLIHAEKYSGVENSTIEGSISTSKRTLDQQAIGIVVFGVSCKRVCDWLKSMRTS